MSPFEGDLVGADGYVIPATQADVFIWIAGGGYDVVFDVASAIVDGIASVATVVREITGWTYQHNRDLTGFQDGTENPSLVEAPEVALIDENTPGAGGSILLFQLWKHDARAWRALPTQRQEAVIGRTKAESIELDERSMPADSHVTRTTLEEGGQALEIFRRNTPYGGVGDHGTVFVGFAKQQQRLLFRPSALDARRMLGCRPLELRSPKAFALRSMTRHGRPYSSRDAIGRNCGM